MWRLRRRKLELWCRFSVWFNVLMTGASFVACQALLHPIGTEQFSQLPIVEQKVVTRSPKSNSHAQNVSPLRIIGVFLQRISYFIKNRMIIMIFSLSLDILTHSCRSNVECCLLTRCHLETDSATVELLEFSFSLWLLSCFYIFTKHSSRIQSKYLIYFLYFKYFLTFADLASAINWLKWSNINQKTSTNLTLFPSRFISKQFSNWSQHNGDL